MLITFITGSHVTISHVNLDGKAHRMIDADDMEYIDCCPVNDRFQLKIRLILSFCCSAVI